MWKTLIGPVVSLFNKVLDLFPDRKEYKSAKKAKIKKSIRIELTKDPRDDDAIMELIDKL